MGQLGREWVDGTTPFGPLPTCWEGPSGLARAAGARDISCIASSRTRICAVGVSVCRTTVLEQAQLVAQDKLDLAAMVTQENAEISHTIISQNGLDIVSPHDLEGLVGRYPWLSLGVIPAGL